MIVKLIRACWIAPIAGPILSDGAIAVREGLIVDVGPYVSVRRRFPDAKLQDVGDCVLLPGLVNAHTHLELSDCRPGDRPTGGLEQWLQRMLSHSRTNPQDLADISAAAARRGAAQCLRFGVTMVGDISRQCQATRPVLKAGPLRVVSFGEIMAMAQRRDLLPERLVIAADTTDQSDTLRIAVSPHSPYSIEIDGYRRCLEVAKQRAIPIATHLAETKSEWEFLAQQSGPLRGLWDSWLTWDDQVPTFSGGPIRMAQTVGLLDYPSLLAHVNYCDDAELAILAAGRASVAYCPRTHDYFGHPPHRFRDMLRAGINVALGTDSCASSPDLNLIDDLRLIHRQCPDLDTQTLWRMATLNSARSLLADAQVGTIEPGKCADLVAFAVRGDDPLDDVLETTVLPSHVWIAGSPVIAPA